MRRKIAGTNALAFGFGAAMLIVAASTFATSIDRVFRNGFDPGVAAADLTWTWSPSSQALCGNGTSTGFGVNKTSLSKHVLIYLEGGGECYSDLTCNTLHTAANFSSGYDQSTFTSDISSFGSTGIFDRTVVDNLFKDYNFVFVPYCTGDDHAGDNVVTYPSGTGYHVGFRNMGVFLETMSDTFVDPDYVVLAGSSAGGLGALFNEWQTQNAFPSTRVDMIDDSGAPMPESVLPMPNTIEQEKRTNWNLAATLPPGCTACANGFDELFDFYASAFSNNRGALLSYNPDSILPAYYGITSAQFSEGLMDLETDTFAPHANLQYFDTGTMGSILLFNTSLSVDGVTVSQFMTKMVTDDPTWTSVHP